MTKRTSAQRIGEDGEHIVRSIIGARRRRIIHSQDKDYGIDLEVELVEPGEGMQELTGKLIKLQVKASEALKISNQRMGISLNREYLRYVSQFRVPVILVAVDTTKRRGWFVWPQKWVRDSG